MSNPLFRCLSFIMALSLTGICAPRAAETKPFAGDGNSMRVLWTVAGYKAGAGAAWSEDEARKMLFKPLDITATSIAFDGKVCREVLFEKEKVTAETYLDRTFHMTPQDLGISNGIMELVKTSCDLPGFAEYLCLPDRRIIIHIHGIFFYLEPAVAY